MKKYKTLFFDLDGTLTDSGEGIIYSYKNTLEHFGIDTSTIDLKKYIGPPIEEAFKELLSTDKNVILEAVNFFREDFIPVGLLDKNKLYDGIDKMLLELDKMGYTICLATGKPEIYSIDVLKHFDIYKYFDFVAGTLTDGTRQEKIEVLNYALESFGFEKETTIMIGDRKYDLEAAEEMGIDGLGVLYGYGSKAELSSYNHVYLAKTVDDVLKFFSK